MAAASRLHGCASHLKNEKGAIGMTLQVGRLTGDRLKKLSPGACRLLLAYKEEPDASLVRCMELTGYSRRWVKTLRQELQKAGAISDDAATGHVCDQPEQPYRMLVSVGVKPMIARELAQQHSWT